MGRLAVMIMASACAVAVAAASAGADQGEHGTSDAGSSKNVVFVLLDDLDVLVGGLTPMPRVRQLLQAGGTTFQQATVATPVCCPSRSILLTSKYNHNIHSTAPGNCMWVNNTSPEWAEAQISKVLKRQNVPVRTAAIGKMLNNHDSFCGKNINSSIVSSWDEFLGLCSDSNFFNDTYNINGTTQEVIPGYQTAVLGNASVDFIERAVGRGERFMLYLAPHAPHIADGTYDYTCQPAPWYENATLPQDQAPRTPAWDVASPDKHWLYSQQQPMDAVSVAWTDRAFRQRWRALLSVDDAVSAIHDTLVRLGVDDETTIVFTSDQ